MADPPSTVTAAGTGTASGTATSTASSPTTSTASSTTAHPAAGTEASPTHANAEHSSSDRTVLSLQLDHETRDNVKLLLFNFSSVLNGKELSFKEQRELLERNRRLIMKLSRIPRFYTDAQPAQPTPKQTAGRRKRRSPSKSRDVLMLPHSLRNEVVDLLFRNQDFAILFEDFFTEQQKKEVVSSNNQVVAKLDDLKNMPAQKQIRRFANFARLTASLTSSEGEIVFLIDLFCWTMSWAQRVELKESLKLERPRKTKRISFSKRNEQMRMKTTQRS